MTEHDIDRIQSAIDHIKTSVDIDPWAMDIAIEAMESKLRESAQPEIIYCKDCKYSRGDVFDRGLYCKHGMTVFDVDDDHYCSWAERKKR